MNGVIWNTVFRVITAPLAAQKRRESPKGRCIIITVKELNRYRDLKKEIDDTALRILRLRDKATSITQTVTGMPLVSGVTDKTAIAADIADAQTELEQRQAELVKEYLRLQRFISSVEEPQMRLIVQKRFIDSKSWQMIALSLGGGNTSEGVKKSFYRFLKTQKD